LVSVIFVEINELLSFMNLYIYLRTNRDISGRLFEVKWVIFHLYHDVNNKYSMRW